MSSHVEEAMNRLLGEPTTCPHGNPIPGSELRRHRRRPALAAHRRPAVHGQADPRRARVHARPARVPRGVVAASGLLGRRHRGVARRHADGRDRWAPCGGRRLRERADPGHHVIRRCDRGAGPGRRAHDWGRAAPPTSTATSLWRPPAPRPRPRWPPVAADAPLGQLLGEIEALMRTSTSAIVDDDAPDPTLARIEELWDVAERQIRDRDPDDLYPVPAGDDARPQRRRTQPPGRRQQGVQAAGRRHRRRRLRASDCSNFGHVELGRANAGPSRPRRSLVVPVGSCEQHGPHLPLHTDTVIAEALARGAGAPTPDCAVAPAVDDHGQRRASGFRRHAVDRQPRRWTAVIVELVRSADWAAGVVLVNGHGGNAVAVERAVDQLERRTAARCWRGGPRIAGGDLHAGHAETSLMLALAPDDVAARRAVAGPIPPIAELVRPRRAARSAPPACSATRPAASADEGHATVRRSSSSQLAAAVDAWIERCTVRRSTLDASVQRFGRVADRRLAVATVPRHRRRRRGGRSDRRRRAEVAESSLVDGAARRRRDPPRHRRRRPFGRRRTSRS